MFRDKVYELCKKIPKGKVSTYREIARALSSRGYRAVGKVLNKNPHKEVPCHRVIGSNGFLVGFASGLRKKARLLISDGVNVRDNKVDLETYFYRFK